MQARLLGYLCIDVLISKRGTYAGKLCETLVEQRRASLNLTGNTILITGGGTGIGRGLAEAFHALGNHVIITGRRENVLQQAVAANEGMEYIVSDQSSAEGVQQLADLVTRRFPRLNVLINNAGVQRVEDLTSGLVADSEETISTNLLGPVRLTAALVQQVMTQPYGAILNVSSALAMMPASTVPTYCATKAALHSYTQSLRFQLRSTPVQVIEIIPPAVQTELHGERGRNVGMPLHAYIAETMTLLERLPEAAEIVVENAKPFRFSECGDYDTLYRTVNERITALQRN